MADDHTKLEASLRKVLNRHGFSYQHAVLRSIEHLVKTTHAPWYFEAAEFPVATARRHTRVDFVLRHRSKPLAVVGECKRINPKFGNWCFVRAPYRTRGAYSRALVLERTKNVSGLISSAGESTVYTELMYELGFELRGEAESDASSSGRNAIEESAAQVVSAMNGLVEFYGQRPKVLIERDERLFVPVVFTTANLFSTELDIAEADLSSGDLPEMTAGSLQPRDWLFFQFAQSREFLHTVPANRPFLDIADALRLDYWRSVGVVSSAGIRGFLQWLDDAV